MDKIAELLSSLAAKLGVTVEYLWPFLVQKTKIDWIANTLTSVLLTLFGLLFLYFARKSWKDTYNPIKNKYGNTIDFDVAPRFAVYTTITALCLLFGVVGLVDNINNISDYFVPEAVTIQNLLKSIK